jgi:very-short-patch-repair endonuclease
MEPLRHITGIADANYMRMRRNTNKRRALKNPNENWMAALLRQRTPFKWTRQAIWGHRIFDFWCGHLGIAVEVDGPEHKKDYDAYRDEYNLRRSGIVVLRVRNLNEADAGEAISAILAAENWRQRRKRFGIAKGDKKQRRRLVTFPALPCPEPIERAGRRHAMRSVLD